MGKVMIVTGGGRGIGAATVRLAAAAGFDVVIVYSTRADAADAVAADARREGAEVLTLRCDVGDERDVAAMFAAVDARFGRLDTLVNCAGVASGSGPLESLAPGDIADVLRINALGTILCAREAMKRMSLGHGGQGGAIINVGSVAARLGAAGFATHYAASKGAVEAFTVGLGREAANQGVRVNAVTPGVIATEMNPAERRPAMVAMVPAGRVGEPEEVAAAILWLASDAASYVNAANIDVAGGR